MELLWKGIGICLLTCILIMIEGKQDRDISLILTIAGTVAVSALAMSYLGPVVEFLKQLSEIASLNSDHINVLVKASGVGIITELAALVCSDSGNSGFGNVLRLLGSTVILWLSVPVFQSLINLISTILGDT